MLQSIYVRISNTMPALLEAVVLLAIVGCGFCRSEPSAQLFSGDQAGDYDGLSLTVSILSPTFVNVSWRFESTIPSQEKKTNIKKFRITICYKSDRDYTSPPTPNCPQKAFELVLPGDVYEHLVGPLEPAGEYTIFAEVAQTHNATLSEPTRNSEEVFQRVLLPVCSVFCNWPAGYVDITCTKCNCISQLFSGSDCGDPQFYPHGVSAWPVGMNSLQIVWSFSEEQYRIDLEAAGLKLSHFEIEVSNQSTLSVALDTQSYILDQVEPNMEYSITVATIATQASSSNTITARSSSVRTLIDGGLFVHLPTAGFTVTAGHGGMLAGAAMMTALVVALIFTIVCVRRKQKSFGTPPSPNLPVPSSVTVRPGSSPRALHPNPAYGYTQSQPSLIPNTEELNNVSSGHSGSPATDPEAADESAQYEYGRSYTDHDYDSVLNYSAPYDSVCGSLSESDSIGDGGSEPHAGETCVYDHLYSDIDTGAGGVHTLHYSSAHNRLFDVLLTDLSLDLHSASGDMESEQ